MTFSNNLKPNNYNLFLKLTRNYSLLVERKSNNTSWTHLSIGYPKNTISSARLFQYSIILLDLLWHVRRKRKNFSPRMNERSTAKISHRSVFIRTILSLFWNRMEINNPRKFVLFCCNSANNSLAESCDCSSVSILRNPILHILQLPRHVVKKFQLLFASNAIKC